MMVGHGVLQELFMATPPSSPDMSDIQPVFAELSKIVLGNDPLDVTLQRIAELIKQVIPDLTDVSVTLIENEKPRTVVFTGQLAVILDERQYESGYGPCTDAAMSGDTIAVAHAEEGSPYPEFSRAAVDRGVTHTVSVGLPVAQRVIGALNLYLATGQPMSPTSVEMVEAFASYAAVAVANAALYHSTADLAHHMQKAMQSRAVIEQAKGVIMAQQRCSDQEAFAFLARTSQRQNQKLRDVAQSIVAKVRE